MAHCNPYDTAEVKVVRVVDGDDQNRGDFSQEMGKATADEANPWRVTQSRVFGYWEHVWGVGKVFLGSVQPEGHPWRPATVMGMGGHGGTVVAQGRGGKAKDKSREGRV
jgi:hypothetical protein